jgi:Domain of Unknown Function with PDB structure (DUF3857)/Transglutaminase-like superfamily
MMNFPRFLSSPLLVLCLIISAAFPVLAGDWKPIDPADLALKAPIVEKDADAEAIFWEVRVADEVEGDTPRTVLTHYVRIKIFTDRGRESQSKIDIPYLDSWKITDIAARTVKPDGQIVELKKSDVFERTIIRSSGLKIKAKSFAMPSVEPGAIIEYRWREVRNDRLANYIRLHFQRDVPVQLVKYYIKPFSNPDFPYLMRVKSFHGENTQFVKEKDGFYSTTMKNVPAFREEPRMPPEDQVRPWLLVYYTEDKKLEPAQYWKEKGKEFYERYKPRMKVSDEVKKAAAETIGDASTPEQKLERLFEFCRTKIKNINDDASGMTDEQRANWKVNKTPADTLKRGEGTGTDIDMLFAALATAAGFETRVVNLSNRSDIFFDPSFPDDYFINSYDIAVRVGDTWRFYDPASTYVPHGMLRWQEEGQDALIADAKEPAWTLTPLSGPEKSKQKRTAKLRLSEDGTLEGDVRMEYTGHFAVEKKEWDDDDSATEREKTLTDQFKGQMSTAELSNIRIENITDPVKPFVYTFHIRVPGYAQRTGKRLFIQPAFFQKGVGPLFPTSSRTHPIYFHYPWSEEDEVIIELPAGFTLDNVDAPSPFNAKGLSQYDVTLAVTKDRTALVYKRNFFFGGGGTMKSLFYPPGSYGQLKEYFDVLHKQDNHTVTLKQGAATATN